MAYTTYDTINASEGLHVLFTYVAGVVPEFIPMVLLAFFMIITFGTFFIQKSTKGQGDFVTSFAVGGYATAIVAVVMTLIPNLINTEVVIATIVIAVIGAIWLYISRKPL